MPVWTAKDFAEHLISCCRGLDLRLRRRRRSRAATLICGRNNKMSQNLVAAIRDILGGGFRLSQGDASDTKFATLNQSRSVRACMTVFPGDDVRLVGARFANALSSLATGLTIRVGARVGPASKPRTYLGAVSNCSKDVVLGRDKNPSTGACGTSASTRIGSCRSRMPDQNRSLETGLQCVPPSQCCGHLTPQEFAARTAQKGRS